MTLRTVLSIAIVTILAVALIYGARAGTIGCGYFASVTHGLEGAVAGAALVPEDWGPQLFEKLAQRYPKFCAVPV
jgi:hypothetical protein